MTTNQRVSETLVINLCSGVKTPAEITSPLLTVYLQYKSQEKSRNRKREVQVSNKPELTAVDVEIGEQATTKVTTNIKTDVIIIPVEDIIQISFKTDVTTDSTSESRAEIIFDEELTHNCFDSCAESLCGGCCAKKSSVGPVQTGKTTLNGKSEVINGEVTDEPYQAHKEKCTESCCDCIRCWCCRRTKLLGKFKRKYNKNAAKAARVLTMTIKYFEYNHLQTPSIMDVTNGDVKSKFFTSKFNPEKQTVFNLINQTDFDPKYLEAKMKEAEILCRTVLHLKSMKPNYPTAEELDKLLEQSPRRTFGNPFQEST